MCIVASQVSIKIKIKITIVASQREGLMHHKFAIVDSNILINGSFNWTERAVSENCENVVISRCCRSNQLP